MGKNDGGIIKDRTPPPPYLASLLQNINMDKYFLLSLLLVAGLFACQTGKKGFPEKSQLPGRWNMTAILQNGQDVSEKHNPKNNRWIELKPDGAFVSDGDPYGRNTGKWTLDDEQTMELFLDSDVGEGDDSYWTITIMDNKVVLKGARSEFTKQFGMVWEK